MSDTPQDETRAKRGLAGTIAQCLHRFAADPAGDCRRAFFTATSMIGFIAGAGIIVRNSIILVDFINLRREQDMPLEEAVVDAGAVRFRPMLLTAAVGGGAGVILFDPIFQGLAISLMTAKLPQRCSPAWLFGFSTT